MNVLQQVKGPELLAWKSLHRQEYSTISVGARLSYLCTVARRKRDDPTLLYLYAEYRTDRPEEIDGQRKRPRVYGINSVST